MENLSIHLSVLIDLNKAQAAVSKRFDASLSVHGVGFTDFILLLHLYHSPASKLRRIDLADEVGVTASGVTRMLAPLEKMGLVGRENNERDARVSYVVLTSNGKKRLREAMITAESKACELLPSLTQKDLLALQKVLRFISR